MAFAIVVDDDGQLRRTGTRLLDAGHTLQIVKNVLVQVRIERESRGDVDERVFAGEQHAFVIKDTFSGTQHVSRLAATQDLTEQHRQFPIDYRSRFSEPLKNVHLG